MQDAWNDVSKLLDEVRQNLVEAGVPARQIKMPEGREANDIKIEQYVKAYDWLHNFKLSPEYVALEKAIALVKPHQWVNYKATGIKGLREQTIRESAELAIRRLWKKNRPSFFGRVYKAREDSDSGGHQQVDSGS